MNKGILTIAVIVVAVGVLTVNGQDGKKPQTVIDSVYTNMAKTCKVLKGGSGQDDASLCEGIGGYRVRVYSSATTTNVVAELKGTDDTFPIASVALDFNGMKGTIEWRTAGGKPFALIMRVPKYGPTTDDNPYIGKLIGEQLVVVGLKGFDTLSESVDSKTPNANAEARAIADKTYAAAKVK